MEHGLRWVVDVDISKYFDTIDHAHLRRFLDQRVTDGLVRRMIDKWLKAGVLEKGILTAMEGKFYQDYLKGSGAAANSVAGADVWGAGTLTAGIIAIALIIPVFVYRHFVQDKGVFPAGMLADLTPAGGKLGEKKASMLPYVTLAAGVAVAAIGYVMFWT